MGKYEFTGEQIETLLKNENVLRCSHKTITYSHAFKVKAVKDHREQYITPKEIFRRAGLDIRILGAKRIQKCMERWTKTYKSKGSYGLMVESRGRLGGRPRIKGLSDKDKIKKLEAQVAYLKAENDFLAKLRAKRAE